ncbi:hypothetical protein A3768_5625 (plasmid) [Ralstonia solanacearum]|nr:hypothetical protein A3768_5625 [Ralstonia solanacearum]
MRRQHAEGPRNMAWRVGWLKAYQADHSEKHISVGKKI